MGIEGVFDRLRRDDWERLGLPVFVDEFLASVSGNDPIKFTSPVEITVRGNGTTSPLTVNNYTQAPINITENQGSFSIGDQTIGGINFGDTTNVFQGNTNGSAPTLPTPTQTTTTQTTRITGGLGPFEATLVGESSDTLEVTYEGVTYTVKKPAKLRGATATRTVSGSDGYSENQLIIPTYLSGDLILVEQCRNGDYVDLNYDARSWCTRIPGDES